jgi:hypothetical protein
MKDLKALKKHILNHVTLQDLLVSEGVLRGVDEQEQISCPFHGADIKKSARYYNRSDSFYCWVCRKSWDLFSYVAERNVLSFKESLSHLISVYRIDISSVPEMTDVLGNEKIKEQSNSTVDERKRYLMQLHTVLLGLRGKIETAKYAALVYSYMVMKFITPDEKFAESAEKMNGALIRVAGK